MKNQTNEKRQLKKYRRDMRTAQRMKNQAMVNFLSDVLKMPFGQRFLIAMRIIRGKKRSR